MVNNSCVYHIVARIYTINEGGFRLMVFVDVNNHSFHIKFERYKTPDP